MSRLNLEQVARTKVMTVHGLTDGVPAATPAQGQSSSNVQNISEAERWGSVLGGAALLLAGLQRGRLSGLITGLIGGSLLYRGYTGHCHAYEALGVSTADRPGTPGVRSGHGVKVEKTITVARPAAELFSFWRSLENLPKVMRHLERVEKIDERRSRWTARGPLATSLNWEAEIINEKEPNLIAWQSLPGSQVETAGSVHFKPAADGKSTIVIVSIKYDPPAGKVAAIAASFLGSGLEQTLEADLSRFKEQMESSQPPASAPNMG